MKLEFLYYFIRKNKVFSEAQLLLKSVEMQSNKNNLQPKW